MGNSTVAYRIFSLICLVKPKQKLIKMN